MSLIFLPKCYGFRFPYRPQCGNFCIFQSLRFYVKSILGILEVQEALNFDFYGFLHSLKAEMYQKLKFNASETAKLADFHLFRIPKIDFT